MQVLPAGDMRLQRRPLDKAQDIDASTSQGEFDGSGVGKGVIVGSDDGDCVGNIGGNGLPAVNW